jgi:hypothetical protein
MVFDIDQDSPSVVVCFINETSRNNRQTSHLLRRIGTALTPVGGKKFASRLKSAKTMELEQQDVIKFFADERMQWLQILSRLRDHYGTEALSRTQVYDWINEAKRGRTDLNTVASPGMEPDEGLAPVIAGKLDADPHLSVWKLAHSLGIAASTICHYLTEELGMKCRHLR